MPKKISGSEFPLSKIYSSDFEFVIPRYQRPYAWRIEEAQNLFEDLKDFSVSAPDQGYFLGSIVLIKEEGKPLAEVIDGQQRLTTLTILLAVLVDFLSTETPEDKEQKNNLKTYVIEPGSKWEGLEAKPRLTLRERDNDFFRKYIQGWKLNELAELDSASLENEAQKNIQANTQYFRDAVNDAFENDEQALVEFIQFLLSQCFLVAVSTPNSTSAFRVFSVMNSRGLELQPTDIIKADIIGNVSEAERDKYNNDWEQMEVDLGRDGFNDLFSHIRMIYVKDKARKSLLEEFSKFVLADVDPDVFVDDVLKPFAAAYDIIKNSAYEAVEHSKEVNEYLMWLNRLEFSDWVPPAIAFMSKNKDKPTEILEFFRLLEREAACMLACSANINQRIEVYGEVLKEIEDIEKTVDKFEWLLLTEEEINEFVEVLDGNLYELQARRRNYILLRLDSFIADEGAIYNSNILTIEHVLPQTVDVDSEWEELWPSEDEREIWLHRIGNLVPLNKRRNSSARNFPFKKKCQAYFLGKDNVTSYALTSQVLLQDEWTPTVVEERQRVLLEILKNKWDLN